MSGNEDGGLDLARCGEKVDQAKKLIDQLTLFNIIAKNSCKKFLQQIIEKIDL